MIVSLDKDNYFTGNYALVGSIEGGVEVKELPKYTTLLEQKSCQYINNKWQFNKDKYEELLKEEEESKQQIEVQKEIKYLQSQLNETDYKIIKCYEYQLAELELPYNIKELHSQRQQIRDQINVLEEQLK